MCCSFFFSLSRSPASFIFHISRSRCALNTTSFFDNAAFYGHNLNMRCIKLTMTNTIDVFIFMLFILSAFHIEVVTICVAALKVKNMLQLIYTRSTHYVALTYVYSTLHYFVIDESEEKISNVAIALIFFSVWTIFWKNFIPLIILIMTCLTGFFRDTKRDFIFHQLNGFIA